MPSAHLPPATPVEGDTLTVLLLTKPWWSSRTLWFNLVCAVLGAAEASLGLIQAVLPVNAFALLAFSLVLGNTALRVISSHHLTLTGCAHDSAEQADHAH